MTRYEKILTAVYAAVVLVLFLDLIYWRPF